MVSKAGKGVGIGVDAFGTQVDPSENVKALSEAANKRQDDLRQANDRLTKSEIRRLDARIKCMKEMAELREMHAKDMREKEVARLDSIRQVDVTAVRTEADRALAAIQTLAATTATNAENLRNALNATAATIAKSTSDTVSQITERIAALEKSSYEGVGKQRLADPQMAELVAEMKSLRESKAGSTGVAQGSDKTWAVIGSVAALLLTLVGVAIAFAVFSRAPATVASPQIVYVPTPAVPPTTVAPPR